ncbi:MAG TPA: HAD family hydrolase [Baekduia sp.]|uniref:HAD family hydrolase n=1 Tax=Baekduia sp. TaxID=2600305 RepID=UPI002D77A371|nr:HAD family hydrolase [Baekduia sp.]HET6510421.1 HAD family hydrolase [Baekduia sp.]
MPTRAVLFDFAGTLAMPEARADWLSACGVIDDDGLGERLEVVGRPGPTPAVVPEALTAAYAARDHDPAMHREAYTGLFETLVDASTATVLYERTLVADGWRAYADAVGVLRALRERGIATALVSNIGFDVRPVLDGLGLLSLLDAVVLSYEVGAIKPEPAIFRAALTALGDVAPSDALMVGDHAADGGAIALGIRSLLLPYSAPGGTHGLAAVLALADGSGR